VTRACANTSTTADIASTRTGAARTSGGIEHEVDYETQSALSSYTTVDTMSTVHLVAWSAKLQVPTLRLRVHLVAWSAKLQVPALRLRVHLVAWSAKVRVKQVSTMQILSAK
jgi:hypothetical protein